ncbi:MAG TPA: macro domain-containing protein, partial [Acidobacteriaceae bacterium]|nr:macro domain-containing protein [Acidobacteriaceae bacterium]
MERTYQLGDSRLTLRFGDIVSSDAQVLVSSDDAYITMGGGVSASILRAGGEAIALDAAKKGPATIGDVVVTTAGSLKAQYVFHAITIGANPRGDSASAIVEQTTRRCMQLVEQLQLSSIAFPAIGAGVAGFQYEDVAASMANVISDALSSTPRSIDVTIYLYDRFGSMSEMDFIGFFEEFAKRAPDIGRRVVAPRSEEPGSEPAAVELAAKTEEEYKSRRIHNLRRLLGTLEDQRGKLEQQLISCLPGEDDANTDRLRKALDQNQQIRLQYLSELQSFMSTDSKTAATSVEAPGPLTVFVSSTYRDLVEHRTAVKDAIARVDCLFRGMEHFGASPTTVPPASYVAGEVQKADVYVGIFGVRYGSIDPATGLSMTELEFRAAETSKKPMLLYIIHEEAPVSVSDTESDPEAMVKLKALKQDMLSNHVCHMFRSVDELAGQTYRDLGKLKASAKDFVHFDAIRNATTIQ